MDWECSQPEGGEQGGGEGEGGEGGEGGGGGGQGRWIRNASSQKALTLTQPHPPSSSLYHHTAPFCFLLCGFVKKCYKELCVGCGDFFLGYFFLTHPFSISNRTTLLVWAGPSYEGKSIFLDFLGIVIYAFNQGCA